MVKVATPTGVADVGEESDDDGEVPDEESKYILHLAVSLMVAYQYACPSSCAQEEVC